MRCDDTLLQLYVDGDLSDGERLVIEEHLGLCSHCRRSVVAYKAMLWDLEHEPPPPVPPELQAVSDGLMEAWVRESPGSVTATWAEASSVWIRTPVIASAVSAVGSGGTSAGKSVIRGLMRLVLGGGGRR